MTSGFGEEIIVVITAEDHKFSMTTNYIQIIEAIAKIIFLAIARTFRKNN